MADLNQSLNRLQCFDLDGLEDVEACQDRLMTDMKCVLKVETSDHLTKEKFMGPTKQVLSRWLSESCEVMDRQRNMIETMKEMIELLKTESLIDKEKVIRLQDKLLQSQDDQLMSMRSTVETTVEMTVQKEIQSYSAAVKKNDEPPLSPETLQKVVVKAIEEEDRSKNLMVFGLTEEDDEQIEKKIAELFAELDEKPRVIANRIGIKKISTTSICRPVKVSFSNSTCARLILSKARRFKQIENRKSVFISPDRSPEERVARKRLVTELKKATSEQPHRRHFIKNGVVCSMDKNGTT